MWKNTVRRWKMEGKPGIGKRDGRGQRPLTDEEWADIKKSFPDKTYFEEDRTYMSNAGNRVSGTMMRNFLPKDGITPNSAMARAAKTEQKERRIEKYLANLAAGQRISVAARNAGLAYTTVTTARRTDPTFKERERDAETQASEPIEDALYEAGISGNVPAAIKWLEKRSAERWPSDKTIIETKATIEIDASDRIGSILAMMAQLQQRAELGSGDYIDVEATEPE